LRRALPALLAVLVTASVAAGVDSPAAGKGKAAKRSAGSGAQSASGGGKCSDSDDAALWSSPVAPTVGAMGYGVPAGIAANLVSGRTAFTIAGDGDFRMNGQELATAAQFGGKSIVVLLNNGMYGTIRMHQEREYPRNVHGTHLANPDFAALARAYGYAGVRITRTAEFEPELLAALERAQGTLIEVMLDPEVISTRGTLSAIRENALKSQG